MYPGSEKTETAVQTAKAITEPKASAKKAVKKTSAKKAVKKKTAKKSKGSAKAKPFPSVKPPQPSVSNTTQQATPNSAVGSQSFTSKDISDIRNDYLQKQSELHPIKPQSPFESFGNE